MLDSAGFPWKPYSIPVYSDVTTCWWLPVSTVYISWVSHRQVKLSVPVAKPLCISQSSQHSSLVKAQPEPRGQWRPLTESWSSFSNGLSLPPEFCSRSGLGHWVLCVTTGFLTPNAFVCVCVCVCLLAALHRLLISYMNHSSDKNRLNLKLFI